MFLIRNEKYKEVIRTCIEFGGDKKDGLIPKTKLAKLCYLADFVWFYENLKSITNIKYYRENFGPLPREYTSALTELIDNGDIKVEKKGKSELIGNVSDLQNNKLSKKQVELIQKICSKWQNKNTEEIVEFTHNQLPWQICEDGEVIPYELITQEEPTNVY